MKYRIPRDDAIVPQAVKDVPAPGQIPEGRIGVYRGDTLMGHVGPKATAITASRFTKRHGAKLTTKDGRPAWVC